MSHKSYLLSVMMVIAIMMMLTTSIAQAQNPPMPPVAPKAEPPQTADAASQLQETVGLLSGLYLYSTYLNIGVLADNRAYRVYEDRAARGVLASVLKPLDTTDRQLEKTAKLVKTQSDRDAIDKLRGIIALLQQLGNDLTTFWDSGRQEDGAKYEATRQETWKQISALMAIEKK